MSSDMQPGMQSLSSNGARHSSRNAVYCNAERYAAHNADYSLKARDMQAETQTTL